MYKSFTEMPVWQKANSLSLEVYKLTIDLPNSEDYGLTSQIRRSSNSVSGNIAEAFGRKTKKDKSNFYVFSRGSAYETQNHLIYGGGVGYSNLNQVDELKQSYDQLIFQINKIIGSLS